MEDYVNIRFVVIVPSENRAARVAHTFYLNVVISDRMSALQNWSNLVLTCELFWAICNLNRNCVVTSLAFPIKSQFVTVAVQVFKIIIKISIKISISVATAELNFLCKVINNDCIKVTFSLVKWRRLTWIWYGTRFLNYRATYNQQLYCDEMINEQRS